MTKSNNNTRMYQNIEILWNYMQLNQPIEAADCLFVLGSNDPRVAEYAAELYLQGFAKKIVFSGGFGRLTEGVFEQPEADFFADIAKDAGVPSEDIIIENKSTNSGENILFTAKRLSDLSIHFDSFILVQKPYMERRAFATFQKQWPLPFKRVSVTSTKASFFDYFTQDIDLYMVLEAMLGDFERIKSYPKLGFQVEQEIPSNVEAAYCALTTSLVTSQV